MAGCLRGRGAGRLVPLALCWLLCCLLPALPPAAAKPGSKQKSEAKETKKLQGKVTYLWPVHFSSIPLAGKGPHRENSEPLESPELSRKLADIGLRRHREYLKEVLPRELKLDPGLAAMWNTSDHSRVHFAFHRWQKRVFAERTGTAVEFLTSKYEAAPKLEGIDYTWQELYSSREFQRLQGRIQELSKLYLKRCGMEKVPSKFKIFTWVEVFEKGDALKPDSRSQGAYLAGRFFASGTPGALKFNFEDARGINPPFGKTYSHVPYEGNLVLFPIWNSYFATPNMKKTPVVTFPFVVYPADGTLANWQKDAAADVRIVRPFKTSVV